MARLQIQKFDLKPQIFRCPHCGQPLQLQGNSLLCSGKHCFDIAAKGYVNLLPAQKALKGYDRDFFENRRLLLDAGFYAHILSGILEHIPKDAACVVDAGCGEGYYAKHIAAQTTANVIAFDIAKDAIHIAATGGNRVLWTVSDLTRIPLADNSADCLLNIFTPANYSEFSRILKQGGKLLKVVPGARHLHQLRTALREHIRNEVYSNEQVVDYFTQHFRVEARIPLQATLPLDSTQRKVLLGMTPLAFHISDAILENCHVDEITIDAELLIGSKI